MYKKPLIILCSLILFSCTKKELNIPTIAATGLQEVENFSQVWFFYTTKDQDTLANINRNSTISATHWVYNIDKRLPLHSFIEPLKELKHKHSSSLHSKEGMHDYMSYSDSQTKILSFNPFDSVQFQTDSILSKFYIKEHRDRYKPFNNIHLTFNTNNVFINEVKLEPEQLLDTLKEFINFTSEGNTTLLHMNFNNRLSYQTYLTQYLSLNSLKSERIDISPVQFIFDQNKIPDCGCQ